MLAKVNRRLSSAPHMTNIIILSQSSQPNVVKRNDLNDLQAIVNLISWHEILVLFCLIGMD